MRRLRIGTIGLATLWLVGCLHAPVLWSPDGQWLAYTMAQRPTPPELRPGWLFADGTDEASPLPARQAARPAPLAYRLWASRAETGESVLLEESRGPLTSPSWSPDGRALAFGRLVPEEDGRARFEVVVQEAPDRKRVVLARAVNEFNARASELPGLALAWSPDNRYLAVPLFQQTLCLGIIRADNGRVLKVIEDAYLPAWSPDGGKLAFVQGSNDAESLHYIDHNFGAPRQLADIGQTSQAPAWFRDGRSLAVVARRLTQRRREHPTEQTDLLRVHVESGKVEVITNFPGAPGDRDKGPGGSSFSFDREGDELFYVGEAEGHLNEIVVFHPRTLETTDKFHPIDHSIRLGALAVSPSGKSLAFRVGSPGDFSTPAVVDLATKQQIRPLVPDDSARVEWLTTLIQTARPLLRAHLPTTDAQNRPLDRPTLLPVPGELPANPDVASRLRRLGRIGRPLCDRPNDAPPADPALFTLLAEARLFFDFLREDYNAALVSLEALEPLVTSRDQRVRLLGVRSQVFLGLRRTDQATKTIAFLEAIEARPWQRFEQTESGGSLTGEAAPGRRWSTYLTERAVEILKSASPAGHDNPLGHRNPDNPNPNADLIPGPAGAPIPFAPKIQVAPPFLPVFPEFEEPAGGIPKRHVFPPRQPRVLRAPEAPGR